jgi:pimeloyl-ACP methyl ester carboxylesterase
MGFILYKIFEGIMTGNTAAKKHFIQSFARKAGRIMLVITSTILACILILVGILLIMSPGKLKPIVDINGNPISGSISEKIHVNINGVDEGMIIQSKDPAHPVLLFMHGGPGVPEYFLSEQYPTGLENDFTVVWWDQRGAGLSYNANIPPETMTVEQIISDTIAVTNYLRNRFHKEKIYLMSHSGGSFFGIQAAARAPELYYAYIGMGQMTYQLKSESLAYDYMLQQYKANGNLKMVRKLEAAPPTLTMPLPFAYDVLRDDAMHGIGVGTTRDMKTIEGGVFFPSWFSRQYTLGEKINLWRGKVFSAKYLRNSVFSTDLTQLVTELALPVYFFHGKYDYTCNYTLAKDYFEKIKAPVKGFYTFEQSAHSPIFEEPEKVRKIFQEDVLAGTNTLADVK